MVVAGLFAGVLVTGLAFPAHRRLYTSGAHGAWTLPQLLHLPYGVVVFGVVLVALAGFAAAERIEARQARLAPAAWTLPRIARRGLLVMAIAALALGAAAAVGPDAGPEESADRLGACAARDASREARERMLTHPVAGAEAFFAELRQREFARLDANRVAYLDYAGSALYAESQINAHRSLLARSVFGQSAFRTRRVARQHRGDRRGARARCSASSTPTTTTSSASPRTRARRSSSSPKRIRSARARRAC